MNSLSYATALNLQHQSKPTDVITTMEEDDLQTEDQELENELGILAI